MNKLVYLFDPLLLIRLLTRQFEKMKLMANMRNEKFGLEESEDLSDIYNSAIEDEKNNFSEGLKMPSLKIQKIMKSNVY